MEVTLSEGSSTRESVGQAGEVTPLPAAPIRELLDRLPDRGWDRASGEGLEGAPPFERSDAGTATEEATEGSEALRVLSVTPAGETRLAPHVTVVFSEPMVPLGMDGEALSGPPPVRLDPQPPGSWRWLDVRTLRFEPDRGRMPAATAFRLRAAASVSSVNGNTLGAPGEWRFATSGVRALGGYPHSGVDADLEPTIFLTFDQRVAPAAVLAAAGLEADGFGQALRLAEPGELTEGMATLMEDLDEGMWVALRPEGLLPPGSEVVLTLGPELTSEEGTLAAGRAQELRFNVREPFQITEVSCTAPENRCHPQALEVSFTSPLDPDQPITDRVRVRPEVNGLRLWTNGDMIRLSGDFRPHTSYQVELSPEIQDQFGQRLGRRAEEEVHFGRPWPMVNIPGAPFLVLDPSANQRIEVPTRGLEKLELELYRVEPEEWQDFRRGLRHPYDVEYVSWRDGREPLVRWTVRPQDGGLGYSRVPVDLSPAFQNGGCHAVLVVQGSEGGDAEPLTEISTESLGVPLTAAAWIQSTSFALGATWSPEELLAWSVSTEDAEPVSGVEVRLSNPTRWAVSDASGLARIPLTATEDSLILARRGDEVAILPAVSVGSGMEAWVGDPSYPPPVWFTLTDRGLYQPGEELEGHGWLRELGEMPGRELVFPSRVDSIRYEVVASGGQAVGEGSVPVTPSGTFHLVVSLPPETRSGMARLRLTPVSGGEEVSAWATTQSFRVEAFRRPDYQVTAEVDPGPYFPGSVIEARVSARYYDGAPLPGASTTWRAWGDRSPWAPPGWTGWMFGLDPGFRAQDPYPRFMETRTLEAAADQNGGHVLRVEPKDLNVPAPVWIRLAVEVRDVNRQAGSASLTTIVHPSLVTAGIRPTRHWLSVGESIGVDVVATDLDGRVAPGTHPVVRALLEADPTRQVAGRQDLPVSLPCEPGAAERLANQEVRPLRCLLRPTIPGRYRIEAEVADEEGRRSLSEVTLYAYGGMQLTGAPTTSGVLITPDRASYEPGDTARLMVSAPVYPVSGLLAVVRNGIREVRPLRLERPEMDLRVPIGGGDAGGVQVAVRLAPMSGARSSWSATTDLNVGLEERRLTVGLEPGEETVAPGDEVVVAVQASDASGAPASRGEVALWVVDEAILNLGGYQLQDPLASLHRRGFGGRPQFLLPHRVIRWSRRPLGSGVLSGEVLDAVTGAPENWLRLTLDGIGPAAGVTQGALFLSGVERGPHHLRISRGDEPVLELDFVMPEDGLDLGTLLVEGPEYTGAQRRAMGPEISIYGTNPAARSFALTALVVTSSGIAEAGAYTVTGMDARLREISGPVDVREVFRALATFQTHVRLDEAGRARVSFRLPDTMTRYRIFAVATHGATRFGVAESAVTAAKDLVVRATPPRSLHPGDEPELSVTVQNASESDAQVEVVARSRGMELTGEHGFRVELPAGVRQEIRVPARAIRSGDADLEVLAAATLSRPAGPFEAPGPGPIEITDAVRVTIPVRPPLAPRAAATHQRLEAGSPLELDLETPLGAEPGFGEVEVDLSTTLLLPLVDLIRGLCLEPSPWPEATAARVLGLAALGDVLESLETADLPTVEEIRVRTAGDVERLEGWLSRHRMRANGWAGPEEGFLSRLSVLHAVHALLVAESAGYLESGRTTLRYRRVVEGIWGEEWRRLEGLNRAVSGWETATAAYALYLAEELGLTPVTPEVREWLAGLEAEDLPVEVLGWLLTPVSGDPGLRDIRGRYLQELANRALTTGATATFRQGGGWSVAASDLDTERFVLASARRSDAAATVALLQEDPSNPLIPGLVQGLLGHRVGDRPAGSHENGWVLLALGRYAAVHEAEGTTATATPILDGAALSEPLHLDSGTPTAVATGPLPAPGARASLELRTEGAGPLYVRAGVRYALLATLDTPAEERGFLVSRRYEAVDDSLDVRIGPDGVWHVRAGARVRVRLTFTAPARRFLVQLKDPIPGGFEPVNPDLRGTGFTGDPAPPPSIRAPGGTVSRPAGGSLEDGPYGWDLTQMTFALRALWGGWATHEQLRDDRMEAFTPFLPAGTYETTYLVRATAPGTFLAPPPRVEETENPEIFGQGKADRVVVEVRR